jgi:hypothetical protein
VLHVVGKPPPRSSCHKVDGGTPCWMVKDFEVVESSTRKSGRQVLQELRPTRAQWWKNVLYCLKNKYSRRIRLVSVFGQNYVGMNEVASSRLPMLDRDPR